MHTNRRFQTTERERLHEQVRSTPTHCGCGCLSGTARLCAGHLPEASADDGSGSFVAFREVEGQWYHPPEFAGDSNADVYRAVYARIAAADGQRSDNGDIDSIAAFGPGNWTYEWDQEGAARGWF
ncbi:alpha/beta hydrolase [Celeribacter baekdonensis]|uniref:Uncharacterized protein n=1 Tax=Celeribacter baekdonensis TaxID=875171 RepID=A0A2R4LXT8_9RHOB|nr:hypothetical protein DA792_00435 [Celeribacter baekdonensis]